MTFTSDEQRREVAKELRKLTTPGCIRYAEEFYEELREIVASDLDGSFEGVANSLADLIDRPTCHIRETDHEFEDSVRCDRCRTTFNRPWEPFKYCPNCGAEVVDDARL